MIMPYRERLAPWLVVQLLPNLERIVRGGYRSRSDADGHLAVLRREPPEQKFIVMFDQSAEET